MPPDTSRGRPLQGAASKPEGHHTVRGENTAAADTYPDGEPRCPLCLHPVPDDPGIAWWLCWILVGLPDPLPEDRWGAVIAAVAHLAGPSAVARGLELAARQPSMAPRRPDAPGARWWREADRQQAAALAAEWRRSIEGVDRAA